MSYYKDGYLNRILPGGMKKDVVEIVGMLLYAYNIPYENAAFPQMHVKNAGQIIVGTKELHKIEYVKKSKI